MRERSFFRLFPDKREVFFYALQTAQRDAVAVIAHAPQDASPVDAVTAALEARCALIQHHPDAALVRQNLLAATAELRERDLTKHAEFADALAEALRARGTAEPAATLVAGTAMTVFRIAIADWVTDPEHQDLPELFRERLSELASMLTRRAR